MDEARAAVAIDLSGRPFCAGKGFGGCRRRHRRLRARARRGVLPRGGARARLTLHVDLQAGTNAHHMIEAFFKAFARALRVAVAIDPTAGVPSTKGTLTCGRGRRLRDGQPAQRREGARARRRASGHHRRPRASCGGRTAIVVPGVGAFPEAMRNSRAPGLDELLRERAAAGVPLLGICLGMQLLFETSTEHEGSRGLGLLPGDVTALRGAAAAAHRLEPRHVRRPARLTAGSATRRPSTTCTRSPAGPPTRPTSSDAATTASVRLDRRARQRVWARSSTPRSPRATGWRCCATSPRLRRVAAA